LAVVEAEPPVVEPSSGSAVGVAQRLPIEEGLAISKDFDR
jgi:hypothetical protein